MKKNIGIIPSIIQRRNSLNFIVENNLIKFLKRSFPKSKLEILFNEKISNNFDIIISTGGNTIYALNKSKANKLRHSLDNFYLKYALKKNISFFGICHGAQFIANYYKSKIKKKKNHTKTKHFIQLNSQKKVLVNSYHNFSIIQLGKELEKLAWSEDQSIESFKHKKKKIFGIMWHPERYKKIHTFDLNFINKYL